MRVCRWTKISIFFSGRLIFGVNTTFILEQAIIVAGWILWDGKYRTLLLENEWALNY